MSEDSKLTLIWCGGILVLVLAFAYGPKIAARLIAGPQERPSNEPKRAPPSGAPRSVLQLGVTAVLLLAVVVLAVVVVRTRNSNARMERRVRELTDEVDDLDGRVQQLEQR